MNKIDKQKLKKMLAEGRYEDIYQVFGEKVYNRYINKYIRSDVEFENGDNKNAQKIINSTPRHKKRSCIAFLTLLVFSKIVVFATLRETSISDSKDKYGDLIKKYNAVTKEYVDNLNLDGYDDIDIFMKLFDDLRNNVVYGEPEIDAVGYMRIDAMLGKGVCRHMADDIAYKLNLINPKYNAKTVEVYLTDDVIACVANLNYMTEVDEENNENTENVDSPNTSSKRKANHRVVFVDLPERNLTLVLDPTNGSMGYLHDGEIDLINIANENHLEYCYLENSLLEGQMNNAHILIDLYKSEFIHESEELDQEFGVEAQNKSLEKVRTMNK